MEIYACKAGAPLPDTGLRQNINEYPVDNPDEDMFVERL